MSDGTTRGAVVFGARNLGRAVIDALVADGWGVTGVARSASTLDGVAEAGATARAGDVTDAADIAAVLREAADVHGRVDLVVNAASPYAGGGGPFGGGPLAEAAPEAFDRWTTRPAQAAFAFLSATSAFLIEQGGPAAVVQVTGGSARRAMPGRGAWAAGCFAVRALTNACALEMREHGIHVALLVVDAGIEPVDGAAPGRAVDALADPRKLADAVLFLAGQGARSSTHELTITPLAERWVP